MKTPRNPRNELIAGLLIAGLLAWPGLVQGQPSAHYVPGSEGIKAATLPPPGFYLRDYNLFYDASQLNDAHGNKIDAAGADAFVYANVPRLLWITETKVLGGYLGVDALLPIEYTSLQVNTPAGRFSDQTFGIGDFFAEGTWSAHPEHFDFALAAGFWAPTGDSSPFLTTRAGAGYWTAMLTAGATWYIDHDKQWAVSALNRYEFNSEKNDTDITPGQVYTLEWGVSRTFMKTWDVGAVGYYQQQVTGTTGTGTSGELGRVAGVGPEISAFFPKIMLGVSFRWVYEFMAESRLQGQTFTLTLTKRF